MIFEKYKKYKYAKINLFRYTSIRQGLKARRLSLRSRNTLPLVCHSPHTWLRRHGEFVQRHKFPAETCLQVLFRLLGVVSYQNSRRPLSFQTFSSVDS